ncbi:MAG: hypothetical protein A2X67_11780 [Ignavibacteria bacterium GWA2_55_11]|nr:MAG: hypothetical protein A2X67_11780 [Ignavibacteria bacterium GWA2_55_11]
MAFTVTEGIGGIVLRGSNSGMVDWDSDTDENASTMVKREKFLWPPTQRRFKIISAESWNEGTTLVVVHRIKMDGL